MNMLVIFRQDEMNLKHIYNDHVNSDMTFAQFKDLCLKCWNNAKFGFMVIDKGSDMGNGRYRKNFDQYLEFPRRTVRLHIKTA